MFVSQKQIGEMYIKTYRVFKLGVVSHSNFLLKNLNYKVLDFQTFLGHSV